MKYNYERTRKNIENQFDKTTTIINTFLYVVHLVFLAGYRFSWNGGSTYIFWNTCVVVAIITFIGMVLVSAVNWYIRCRLIKALDEEKEHYETISRVA